MEPLCIRQTSIPGTTKLFGDFLYDFDRVSSYYHKHFSDESAWPAAASEIEYPAERRKALVDALREQNGDSAALSKLGQPSTVAVVTGQQVGLFSGPAYTVYKALTAVKLAAQLDKLGIPAGTGILAGNRRSRSGGDRPYLGFQRSRGNSKNLAVRCRRNRRSGRRCEAEEYSVG